MVHGVFLLGLRTRAGHDRRPDISSVLTTGSLVFSFVFSFVVTPSFTLEANWSSLSLDFAAARSSFFRLCSVLWVSVRYSLFTPHVFRHGSDIPFKLQPVEVRADRKVIPCLSSVCLFIDSHLGDCIFIYFFSTLFMPNWH